MDHRAGVIAGAATATSGRPEIVQAEQAIFTSIRTPMGEGYRLVAMSPGITSEERAEITRRSPSHGSLCDPDPAAMGLASYPLASQRQCVAWTRYAGREHTARGGQRVHTHLAVLEQEGFRAFAFDPFRVLGAMAEVIGEAPNIKPSTCLPALTLGVPSSELWASLQAEGGLLGQACGVAAALMDHDVLLVVGAGPPWEVLRWAVAVLPQVFRPALAASANLQFAPARQMRITCLPQNSPELQRAIAGQDVHVYDPSASGRYGGSLCAAWFDFLIERNDEGRLPESIVLADQLDVSIDAAALGRIVSVCRDADRIDQAAQEELEALVARYADVEASHPVEARLMRQALSAAVRRASELQHAVVQ